MEGPTDRQGNTGPRPGRLDQRRSPLDLLGITGNHDLAWGVQIGNVHAIQTSLGQNLFQPRAVQPQHGRHCPRRGGGHQFGPAAHDAQGCFKIHHPCCLQGVHFAQRMACQNVGHSMLVQMRPPCQSVDAKDQGLCITCITKLPTRIVATDFGDGIAKYAVRLRRHFGIKPEK